MNPAESISRYLVEFNAALETRLGRRRRILAEVEDHLREAVARELERGSGPEEAEAVAIAAFGSPERVAREFGSDPLARLPSQIVTGARRLDEMMARRPWAGASVTAFAVASVYAAMGALGAAFHAPRSRDLLSLSVVMGLLAFVVQGSVARALRGRGEPGLRARWMAWRRSRQARKGLSRASSPASPFIAARPLMMCPPFVWLFTGATFSVYVWMTSETEPVLSPSCVMCLVLLWVNLLAETLGEVLQTRHPWVAGLGPSFASACAYLVFLALDAGTPIGLRLGVAVLVVVLAGITWLSVGALQAERSARVVQRALVLRHQRAVDVSELERSAEEARANGELERQVAAVAQLADLQLELGEWSRAQELYEQALQLYRMLGDRSREASVLVDLARCFAAEAERCPEPCERWANWKEALSRCKTAHTIFRWELADPLGEARALERVGQIRQAQGRLSAAVMLLREALDAYRAGDSRRDEASCLARLADASLKEGDVDEAAAFCSQSREVSRELGDRDGEALALSTLGDVRVSEGDLDDAMGLYEKALAAYQATGNREGEAQTLWKLGDAFERRGDVAAALANWRRSATLLETVGSEQAEMLRFWRLPATS